MTLAARHGRAPGRASAKGLVLGKCTGLSRHCRRGCGGPTEVPTGWGGHSFATHSHHEGFRPGAALAGRSLTPDYPGGSSQGKELQNGRDSPEPPAPIHRPLL